MKSHRAFRFTGISAAVAVSLVGMAAAAIAAVQPSPVAGLIGTWAGSGRLAYTDGSSESISCNAYYTGGSTELRMSIQCQSDKNPIHIRSQLRTDGVKATGTWEERTFNVSGTAEGQIGASSINLSVTGGGLSGSMAVSYGKTAHTVSIRLDGIALKGATMNFSKR